MIPGALFSRIPLLSRRRMRHGSTLLTFFYDCHFRIHLFLMFCSWFWICYRHMCASYFTPDSQNSLPNSRSANQTADILVGGICRRALGIPPDPTQYGLQYGPTALGRTPPLSLDAATIGYRRAGSNSFGLHRMFDALTLTGAIFFPNRAEGRPRTSYVVRPLLDARCLSY